MRLVSAIWMLAGLSLLAGCGHRSSLPPAGDSLPEWDANVTADATPVGDIAVFADAGECTNGELAPVGKLCVGKSSGSTQVTLLAGEPIPFQVYPKGCFSSSATVIHKAFCSVTRSGPATLVVKATFCIEDTGCDQGCTPDCSGGGWAECSSLGLPAGTYTAVLDELTVNFAVPSTLTFGGLCKGEQF